MANLLVRLLLYANGNANMAKTYHEDGSQSRTIIERKIAMAKELSEKELLELYKKQQNPDNPNILEKLLKKKKKGKA